MTKDRVTGIVGGGPAGLSAALTLARAGRRSVVFEAPTPPRNAASMSIGGLPGQDGVAPEELRRRIRDELVGYGCTEFSEYAVSSIAGSMIAGFSLTLSDATSVAADHVILACGRVDLFPDIEGFSEYWAKSIHSCPYCGGYADRGKPWGIVANRQDIVDYAEVYLMWSEDLVLFAEPGVVIDAERRDALEKKNILVETSPIRKIIGDGGRMQAVELADGRHIARSALNWVPGLSLPDLVKTMDLALTERGDVRVDEGYHTSRAGIYAAGDLTYSDHQTVATALHLGGVCAASVVFDQSRLA